MISVKDEWKLTLLSSRRRNYPQQDQSDPGQSKEQRSNCRFGHFARRSRMDDDCRFETIIENDGDEIAFGSSTFQVEDEDPRCRWKRPKWKKWTKTRRKRKKSKRGRSTFFKSVTESSQQQQHPLGTNDHVGDKTTTNRSNTLMTIETTIIETTTTTMTATNLDVRPELVDSFVNHIDFLTFRCKIVAAATTATTTTTTTTTTTAFMMIVMKLTTMMMNRMTIKQQTKVKMTTSINNATEEEDEEDEEEDETRTTKGVNDDVFFLMTFISIEKIKFPNVVLLIIHDKKFNSGLGGESATNDDVVLSLKNRDDVNGGGGSGNVDAVKTRFADAATAAATVCWNTTKPPPISDGHHSIITILLLLLYFHPEWWW